MRHEFESGLENEVKEFTKNQQRAELLEKVKKLRLLADELEKMAWSSDYSELQEVHIWNICTSALIGQIEMTPEEHEKQCKRSKEWEAAISREKKKAALREKVLK